MNEQDKTKEELIKELHELQQASIFLKALYEKDITTHKQTEEVLKNSLSLLDTIFESIHNGILVVSHQGTIIKTNTKFAEMWHIPSDILISADSKILLDYVREQLIDPNGFIARVSELYEKPEAESLDEIPLKDGRVFKRILKPMYLVGKPIGKVWSFLDITERKRDEAALQESEALYRNLVVRLPDGVYKSTHDGKFLEVNPAMVKMLGYASKEELIAIDIKTQLYFKPADRESVILQEKLEEMGVFRLKKKDGSEIWVEDHGWYIMDENGNILFHEGIMRDITERKKAEDTLVESEERYRIFINSTKDMVFLKDDKLNYLLVNEAMATFFGTEERKIIGKSDFDLMPEKTAQKCLISDEQALNSVSVVVGDEQVGDKIFNTQKFKVPFSNGRYGIGGYIRDVTERREAERKLINQAEEMKELNATKDKFFSIISHDLRSPFQIFLGFTRMMAEELPTLTLDEIQKIAVSMRSSANNLFNLLENLLQWSQMQRGLSSFKPEPFILSNGIVAIIELVREAADKKKIALNYDVPEGLTVLADAQMFESLMHNLIFNAVKFTPKGGKISIVAKPMPDNSVEISIKDTGIGMNKNMVENLFRLDMQTNRKGTEGEPSTGLGLIICKDFVEKHGGKIWVESEEGKGTTFYFTL